IMLLFFFSSRRRHTRSKRDWSSDVCSSDLVYVQPAVKKVLHLFKHGFTHGVCLPSCVCGMGASCPRCKKQPVSWEWMTPTACRRSEERRVGTGGRSGRVA